VVTELIHQFERSPAIVKINGVISRRLWQMGTRPQMLAAAIDATLPA
jgi:hypothetical protein